MIEDDDGLTNAQAAQHLDDWLGGKEVPGKKIKASVERAVEVLRDYDKPMVVPIPPYSYDPPSGTK